MTTNTIPFHQIGSAKPPTLPEPGSISEIFQLLERASRRLKHIQRLTVQQTGLTPSQFYILKLLWECDRRPFKELARELICSRATITGIVDTLQKNGFIQREPNPDDRRSLLAALTEKGRSLQGELPDLEVYFNQCCSGLSKEEFQTLRVLLVKLNISLESECGRPDWEIEE
jgi:MarR family 2-MHQ and catechol resistance regulon transcriptional repressor